MIEEKEEREKEKEGKDNVRRRNKKKAKWAGLGEGAWPTFFSPPVRPCGRTARIEQKIKRKKQNNNGDGTGSGKSQKKIKEKKRKKKVQRIIKYQNLIIKSDRDRVPLGSFEEKGTQERKRRK